MTDVFDEFIFLEKREAFQKWSFVFQILSSDTIRFYSIGLSSGSRSFNNQINQST